MLGTVLPSIFLGVAAFLLNVVVSRLVATQREQIAALKALGYPNRTIAAHYLKLVLAIVARRPGARRRARRLAGHDVDAACTPSSSASRASSTASRRGCCWSASAITRGHRGARHAQRDRSPPCGWRRPRRCARRRRGATGARCSSAWASRASAPALRMILRNMERRPLRTGAVDRRRRGGGGDRRHGQLLPRRDRGHRRHAVHAGDAQRRDGVDDRSRPTTARATSWRACPA